MIVGAFLVIAFIIFSLILIQSRSISLSASLGSNGVIIHNEESGRLEDCNVSLNRTYDTQLPVISVGLKSIEYSDFTDESGQRFNFYETKPETLHINCKGKNVEALDL